MDLRFDTVIVGAGLAGACAARILARDRRVLLADAGDHDAASPAAVAALANPLMAQRARPGWRVIEAVAAYERLVRDLAPPDTTALAGLLRPAATSVQAEEFAQVAEAWPDLAAWWSADEVRHRAGWIEAPHGALRVTRGGALSVPSLLESLRRNAAATGAECRGAWRLEGWDGDGSTALGTPSNRPLEPFEAVFRTDDGAVRVITRRLVLATGPCFDRLQTLRGVSLHRVKGQVVRVLPSWRPDALLPVSGRGYAAPMDDGTVVIGSSYEHDFDDSAPTLIQSRRLLARMVTALPWLRDAAIVSEAAGLRVTVPGRRTPMVGPLPGHPGVWMLTGLGSKGLLMAPYLAEELPGWLDRPDSLPHELRVVG